MSAAPFTIKHLAEQAGSAVAENCIRDIQEAPDQSERVAILQRAILEVQRIPHPKRAAAGFAVGVVAFLERGVGVA